ncbi:hypothetical protein L4D06_08640 [Enterovibrio makurazakiensis]|uniref:hypothetical protein n=1 Tax=Enterovibrio makurazakiensis TaxID=2910232 RepID=UPI003D256AFB
MALLITPDGREFAPVSLMAFRYGVTNITRCVSRRAPVKPSLPPVTVYRGGKRQQPAPWIPIRDKLK